MHANNQFGAAVEAVMQLDLTPIKGKLMHVASGEGWSLEKTNAVEREYRRFLCLSTAFPDESIAPLVDVDTFWHYHILDTMKYAADCQQAFGYFLHHYPYVGLGDEDDGQARIDTGERTRSLYLAMFGEAFPDGCEASAPAAALAAGGDATVTAWCASPGQRDGSVTAWCASPGSQERSVTAWCASPGSKHALQAGRLAWCASPGAKTTAAAGAGATAWCASPGARNTVQAGTIAWCASPGAKAIVAGGAGVTAWCASPGGKTLAAAR